MTRFARAKGSKSSNERVPEEATSWSEMKNQLLEKNKQIEEAKHKQEADKQRSKNYKTFLQNLEEERSKNSKWAEFPTSKPQKSKRIEGNNNTQVVIKKKKGESVSDTQCAKPKKNAENGSRLIEKSEESPKKAGGKVKQKKRKAQETVTKITLKKIKKVGKTVGTSKPSVEKNEELGKDGELKKNENKVIKKSKKGVKRKSSDASGQEGELKKVIKKSKKALKRKSSDANSGQQPVVKKAKKPEELSEEDLKKMEKKKQKKLRQLDKKRLKVLAQSKNKDGKTHNRRKNLVNTMFINGKEIEIAYVDGFPVKKEEAVRLNQLRKDMISKGLPGSEIKKTLKLERRKAEKAFAREKKKVCFNCRKSGHNLSECPELGQEQLAESAGTGICFKCGSTEHTHFECKVVRGQEFKFAQCFICHEQGHIARQCPDNARGLYPKGGACRVCGDVTHLKKDCPKYQDQQRRLEENVHLEAMGEGENPDSLGKNEEPTRPVVEKRKNKIIKF